MPAHRRGAVAAKSSPVGTRSTNDSSTTMFVEYPPKVGPPRYLSSPLYVKVGNDRQYCSNPAWQFSQVRHESTMHPTALRSPGLLQVGVTDPAVENFDFDIQRAGFPPGNTKRSQRRSRGFRCIRSDFGRSHVFSITPIKSPSLAERATLLAKHATGSNVNACASRTTPGITAGTSELTLPSVPSV